MKLKIALFASVVLVVTLASLFLFHGQTTRSKHDALIKQRFRLSDDAREADQKYREISFDQQEYWKSCEEEANEKYKGTAFEGDKNNSIYISMEREKRGEPQPADVEPAAQAYDEATQALESFDRAHLGIAQELGYKPGEWR